MKDKSVFKTLSSYKTTIILLIIYALGLAIATFIEKFVGTVAAKLIIYYSPAFFFLQFLLVLNFLLACREHKLFKKKKWGFIMTHIALIVILSGAMITHLFGMEGTLHLREGQSSNKLLITTNKGQTYYRLPFRVELEKFTLIRYPGSSSPSSFESQLLIHVDGQSFRKIVSMNNVLNVKSYRFFQASYDKDEKGTILSVNQDIVGRNVTYFGYFMLIMGFVLFFLDKKSRFRQLGTKLKKLNSDTKPILLFIVFFLTSLSAYSKNTDRDIKEMIDKISMEHASKFGSIPVQKSNGRMVPINTVSSEILRKLYRSNEIGEGNSDQFLLSLISFPQEWMHIPMIKNSNKTITKHYGLPKGNCAYKDFFKRNGAYKLEKEINEAYQKPQSQRSRFDKDLIKIDEKINIIFSLTNYRQLNMFPKQSDPNNKWYAAGDDLSIFSAEESKQIGRLFLEYIHSVVEHGVKSGDWSRADESLNKIVQFQYSKTTIDISSERIEAELLYNKLEIFNLCKKSYLILGAIMLVLCILALFHERRLHRWGLKFLTLIIVSSFLYHLFGMGLRWYIGGYAPWSNSYETMIYISFITVLAGFIFARRSAITLSMSILFAGVILFVSELNWMDPQINTLVPVLNSPWLMFHVAVIVAAYGFFGVSMLLGINNLIICGLTKWRKSNRMDARLEELTIINEMSLWIGLALMTIGTFLGAIWANESWGRYWGWDPKETWALITILVYAIMLHVRLLKKCDTIWFFNLFAVLAFLSVLMTYFGVNYFLSGLHSYA